MSPRSEFRTILSARFPSAKRHRDLSINSSLWPEIIWLSTLLNQYHGGIRYDSRKTSPNRDCNNRSVGITLNNGKRINSDVSYEMKARAGETANGRMLKYLNVNSSSLPIFYSSVFGLDDRAPLSSWHFAVRLALSSSRACTFILPRHLACRLAPSKGYVRTSRIYSSLTRPAARIAASPAVSWISEFVIHPLLAVFPPPFCAARRLCLTLSRTRSRDIHRFINDPVPRYRHQHVSKRFSIASRWIFTGRGGIR